MMNQKSISEANTADFRRIQAALARAAEAARSTAKLFNTPLIVQQNGQLVKLMVN
jgi:hypothetical protein